MRRLIKLTIIFLSLIIIGYALYWYISDFHYKETKFRNIVGRYKLDTNRTDLGIYKDSIYKYTYLTLTFTDTFNFVGAFSKTCLEILLTTRNILIINTNWNDKMTKETN